MVCHQSLSSMMSNTELSQKISVNMDPPALANHAMISKNVQCVQEQNYHLSLYVGKV